MFPRISKVKIGGKIYEYVRIVENYRENGKKRQKVIANLGRVEAVVGKMDSLVEGLRDYCKEKFVKPGEITSEDTPVWGTILVARKLWNDLGLSEIIRNRCSKYRKGFQIEETAFVLVASSLVNPSSEHGLGWWLETSYVCDSQGNRFLPLWKENVSKQNRVRIQWKQLEQYYRTLDGLYKAKDDIEKDIYRRLRDIFGLKVDIVFYDITSLYFEGEGPEGLAEFGKSKDGKNRNRQILLGVVMASGWPVAHHVFSGNTSEKTTVVNVIDDLKKRFDIQNIIFIGDSGMITKKNLKHIAGKEYKYIIAMKRRRNNEVKEVLTKIKEKGWQKYSEGTWVQEVKVSEGKRYFVARSDERKAYEKEIRTNNMRTTKQELEALEKSVNKGKKKEKPEDIGYRASSILKRVKGYRYYSWEITKDGKFKYWEDATKINAEKLIEGKYILKSNDPTIKPLQAVTSYKELSNIEGVFREFKDVLEGRPIWHQTPKRVKAHVFVRALGYLLDTALRKALDKSKINLTVEEAIQSLQQVTIANLNLRGEAHQIVCGSTKPYARSVLNAVGLTGYKKLLPSQVSNKNSAGDMLI